MGPHPVGPAAIAVSFHHKPRPVIEMSGHPSPAGHPDLSARFVLMLESRGLERLRAPSVAQRRQLSHWRLGQMAGAVERSRDLLARGGVCLPIVWMADGLVVPVVRFDSIAVDWRTEHGHGPIIDRTWWRDASATNYIGAPPAALSVLGFLSVGRLSRARSTLARLRPTAPVAAVLPSQVKPDPLELAHWDYYGLPVYAADEHFARPVVTGSAWTPGAGTARHFQTRLRLEQLFEVAIRSGALTAHSPAP